MINTYLHLPNKPMVFSIPSFSYNDRSEHANIDRVFELYQRSVVVNLHPSRNYLKTFARNEKVLYNEIDKALCKGSDNVKINEESKFARMRKNNLLYDETIGAEDASSNCIPNCSLCCSDLFFVSENEFLYIITWLLDKRKKKEIAKAYLRGRKQMLFLSENHPEKAADIKREYTAYEGKFYNIGETVNMLESCPFLNEQGRCVCYEARPGICRKYGMFGSCIEQYRNATEESLYDIFDKKAIVVNPIFDEIIKQNMLLNDGKRYFMKQAHPLFYFTEKYLGKANVKQTIRTAKEFAEKTEADFLAENLEDIHEFNYEAGKLIPIK